jgi:predicted transcriptional regulator
LEEGIHEAATKHELIIRHISSLSVGTKISVRGIAKALQVSEGTAYRAIKEAENQGIVSTKERIGTVRVEMKQRQNIDKLTFAEVVNIVDGHVLGGSEGLEKTLNKFVIGAMEEDAMMRYIEAGSLLIVGNRNKAHMRALEQGAGVLVTGGFDISDSARRMADDFALPIISSSYDTFTVASLINRAIYDRLIKKKIMLVEDLIGTGTPVYSLRSHDTVEQWQRLTVQTGHSRFPVVDEWNRVIGIVTSKDAVGVPESHLIEKVMTRNPLTITPQSSVASTAHLMVWEGIDLLPVVDGRSKLIAVISRKDVLKAMQFVQRQPQIGETFEDLILSGFEENRGEQGELRLVGTITPQMTNQLGTLSNGVLTTLMTQAAFRAVKEHKKGDLVLENMSSYFLRPVQIDNEIDIRSVVIEVSRKFIKVDVEVYHSGQLMAKAILAAQVIDQG